jgi:predicted negative regulator of RcsB-dependent stress response
MVSDSFLRGRAITDCTEAIKLSPNIAEAYWIAEMHYWRGEAYNAKGDLEKAIADYA